MKLAYDVGANDGNNTAHYLDMAYRVVAIDADPTMTAKITARFPMEIDDGRLTVLNVGVGNREGVLPFYLAANPGLNSFERAMAERAGKIQGVINVPMRKLADVIADNGMPDGPEDFVKIDVEGVDYECLQSLEASGTRPQFLSCEAGGKDGTRMIELLMRMGFNQFSLINQHSFAPVTVPNAGTFGSVRWAARQYLRQRLRGSMVHSVLRKLKDTAAHGNTAQLHAGPSPMEHINGWSSPSEFLWIWKNVADSGLIDSAWFDIHAKRGLAI